MFKWSRNKSYAVIMACVALFAALVVFTYPKDVSKAMERAKAFRAKGENASAAIELKNVLAARPKDHDAFFLAGQVMADLGDLVNAENSLRRSIEHGHAPAQVLPVLGRVLLDLEKYPEAVRVLGEEVDPGISTAPEIAVLRGRAYLGQDLFGEAETQFRLSKSIRASAAATLGLAQLAMAEHNRAAAEGHVAEVLRAEPKNVDALMVRAELFRTGGRVDDAAAALRRAIEAEPANAAALFALTLLELGRDRIDTAQPLLRRLQKLKPQSPRLRYARAVLAFKRKRNDDARAELKRLAQVIPDYPPGLLLVGMVQYTDGRYDQAQSAFGAYLKRYPGDMSALRMLGATLLAKGQPHLAVNVFAPVIASTQNVGVLAVAAEASRLTGRFDEARTLLQRAIGQEPRNPDLRTILALTDLGAGARARAISGLEAAIALGPSDARADDALIMVLLGQNQIEQAEKVAAALAQRMPKASQAHTLKAAVSLAKREFPKARESLEFALQLDPANLDAVEALADVDAAENKPDSRRERIEAILKRDPKHVGALLALAKLDLALGRHAQSVASIRQSLASHPQSINALLMLADAQFRQRQFAEAEISAHQAHDLHPKDTRAIALLAEIQMAMGDKQAAIETLSKLTKQQPDVISGYLRLASAYLAASDPVNARSTALTAYHKDPKHRGARALLTDIYIQTGQLTEAAALAAQTQKDEPKSALGYRMEGDVRLARKDFAGAAEAYKKAAAIQLSGSQLVKMHQAERAGSGGSTTENALRSWVSNHPEDFETRFYLADALSDAGRFLEAASHYKRVLRSMPNSARALNNLAWALHGAGDKAAVQYARKSVRLFPSSAAALDTLGWILVEQRNPGEGVPALLKAVAQDGNNPEIRYHLAQAMVKIGDIRRAKAELRKLLESKEPFRQLAEARALAAQLGP